LNMKFKISNRYFLFLSVIMINMVTLLESYAQAPITEKASAGIFVQKFYDWYVPLYNAPTKLKPKGVSCDCADIIALKQKPEYFDPILLKAILDDSNAQAKVKDDDVGLDFDPFLSAQDIGFIYQAGNVKQVKDSFFVDVHYAFEGKSKKEVLASGIAVITEVVRSGTNWKFSNFIYPADGNQKQTDLLKLLANLRNSRKTQSK